MLEPLLTALARGEGIRPLPRAASHASAGAHLIEKRFRGAITATILLPSERPRARGLRFKGEEPCKDIYKAHPSRHERPRCLTTAQLEKANRKRRMDNSSNLFGSPDYPILL